MKSLPIRSIALLASVCLGAGYASAAVSDKSSSDEVLAALHDAGKDLKSVAAKVELGESDPSLGEESTREGKLVLERKADGDTRIRATFEKYKIGKRTELQRKDYLLSGQSLVERDWKNKKQTTRIVRKPGEKLDLFKLGQGPFPLPIGQPPEDVKKEFDVAKVAPGPDAKKDLVYLELTPKAGTQLATKFKRITVGVRADGWPVEISTTDPNETVTRTARLSDIRVNDAVKPNEFDLEKIDETWSKVDEADSTSRPKTQSGNESP